MKYPDIVISKSIPTIANHPRRKHYLAVVEIKINHNTLNNINRSAPQLEEHLVQLAAYCTQLGNSPHAKKDAGQILPAYLIYGDMYTKLELRRETEGGALTLQGESWQYVFEHLDPDVGMAPFLYRMCQLATTHWNL